ncbi:excalibur calcium-binding domain-containing protein [Solibacillus daqui]|uniref:excalibur calcium-binding domain-containing protein n=1 Tax=Solibacillus daqui TaxID=2912187 RepID=UPI0023655AEC|nr:excalibur calcium-binding domain-containing protein [Solibacillus daqui]
MSVALIGSVTISTIEAEASTKVKIVEYKNCKEINAIYSGGIAKSATVKNVGGKTKYKPFVSAELYAKNNKSDRDNDGIACER